MFAKLTKTALVIGTVLATAQMGQTTAQAQWDRGTRIVVPQPPVVRVPVAIPTRLDRDYQLPPQQGSCRNQTPSVGRLTDQLIQRIDQFLYNFEPQLPYVPNGWQIADYANSLRDSAIGFRQALRRGEHPQTVLARFAQLDRTCGLLVNRVNRTARGGWGPNIALVNQIGEITQAIGQSL